MATSLVTWNSRGNPLNNTLKQNALADFLSRYDYVLLQECGALAAYVQLNLAGMVVRVWGADQAGAFNIRCSSAILSQHAGGQQNLIYLQTGTGRFCIALNLPGNLVIATMHSAADGSAGTDRTGALKALVHNYPNAASIIVGADWNDAPPQGFLLVGSFLNGTTWDVAKTGAATHTNGSEYDYFLYRGATIPIAMPVNEGSSGSDHSAVGATFT